MLSRSGNAQAANDQDSSKYPIRHENAPFAEILMTYLRIKMVSIDPSTFLNSELELVCLLLSFALSSTPLTFTPSPSASPRISLSRDSSAVRAR